jgi:hypothetical protein
VWLALAIVAVGLLVSGVAAASLAPSNSRVRERQRADGVHPALQALLDAWEREGTHTVVVGGGDDWPSGGVRTDALGQASAAAAGLSNAITLAQTPHGRGAALDIWPDGFDPRRSFDAQPGMRELMAVFGQWAEAKGFAWGGRWTKPDMPHVEIRDWRSLPFPPPDYRGAA